MNSKSGNKENDPFGLKLTSIVVNWPSIDLSGSPQETIVEIPLSTEIEKYRNSGIKKYFDYYDTRAVSYFFSPPNLESGPQKEGWGHTTVGKLLEYHFSDGTFCYSHSIAKLIEDKSLPYGAAVPIDLNPAQYFDAIIQKGIGIKDNFQIAHLLRRALFGLPMVTDPRFHNYVDEPTQTIAMNIFMSLVDFALRLQNIENLKYFKNLQSQDKQNAASFKVLCTSGSAVQLRSGVRLVERLKWPDLSGSSVDLHDSMGKFSGRPDGISYNIKTDINNLPRLSVEPTFGSVESELASKQFINLRGLSIHKVTGAFFFQEFTQEIDEIYFEMSQYFNYLKERRADRQFAQLSHFGFELLSAKDIPLGVNFIIQHLKPSESRSRKKHNKNQASAELTQLKQESNFNFQRVKVVSQDHWVHFHQDKGFSVNSRYLASLLGKEAAKLELYTANIDFRLMKDVLSVLEGGLAALLPYKSSEIISTRNKSKRQFELKLLRHSGFAIYVWLECTQYILKEPLIAGSASGSAAGPGPGPGPIVTSRKALIDTIFSKLDDIFPSLAGETGMQNLQKTLSKSTRTTVGKLIEDLLEDLGTPATILCQADGATYFLDFRDQISAYNQTSTFDQTSVLNQASSLDQAKYSGLILLRNWLNLLIEQSQGKILFKEKDDSLKDFVAMIKSSFDVAMAKDQAEASRVSGWYPIQKIKGFDSNLVFAQLLELTRSNFRVSVDNKELEVLNPEEFTATFKLTSLETSEYFELHPKVFFKGVEISLDEAELLDQKSGLIEYRGQLFAIPKSQIPKLKSLDRFWKKMKSQKFNSRFHLEQKIYKLPQSQTLEMLRLRAAGVAVIGNKEWQEVCAFYDSLTTVGITGQNISSDYFSKQQIEVLSSSLYGNLLDYQKQGVRWLYDLYTLRLGGLLADDMGLGKTIQTLAFLKLAVQHSDSPNLIVVPTSLSYNWQAEAIKFTPDLKLALWTSTSRDNILSWVQTEAKAILVVSYGIFTEHKEILSSLNWNTIIFDEAQNLKNIVSNRTSTARSFKARFKLGLSGTPLENNYTELFSLVDLVLPGALGSITDFQKTYGANREIKLEDIQLLKELIKPIVLRRTKAQVSLNLPAKNEFLTKLVFQSQQKALYKNLASSMNESVNQLILEQGEAKAQLKMFTALLRLRQVCSDPACLPNTSYEMIPPKVELLLETIKEHIEAGDSVLVFTQFRITQERVLSVLKSVGIQTFEMHGEVTQAKRIKTLAQFNESEEAAVLVMTLKTGGVGLNLTKASVVIHLEPWWNPAVENQATDRAHRLGQKNEVRVYRYIMQDSCEEKIELLKASKAKAFSLIFDSSLAESDEALEASAAAPLKSRITHDDFKFLLQ